MMTPEEAALHRQLLAAFNAYIKHNLRWEEKGYYTDTIKARKALRDIIDAAYLRWKEIQIVREGRDEKPVMGKEVFRDLVKKHSKSRSKGSEDASD